MDGTFRHRTKECKMINLAWAHSWKVTFALLIGAGSLFAVFGGTFDPRSSCNIFLFKSTGPSDCVHRALKQCCFCKWVRGFYPNWWVLGGKEKQESVWCSQTISISWMIKFGEFKQKVELKLCNFIYEGSKTAYITTLAYCRIAQKSCLLLHVSRWNMSC